MAESDAEARTLPMDKPLILSLDSHGVPHRWISWQQACFYYAKNLVAWTLGDETFTYYGGISRITGERSSITAHSIVAIKGKGPAAQGFNPGRSEKHTAELQSLGPI